MAKAKLIVLDGADNAGKATQAALLLERLKKEGKKVGTLDFPQYTVNTFGKLIKECLHGLHGDFLQLDPKIASALYAADRFESKNQLCNLLEEMDVVILDRYVSANMLHQGAKIENEEERKEFLLWLENIEYGVYGVPKPDLTIALQVDGAHNSAVIKKMIADGEKILDDAEKNREHQARVRECLLWLSSFKKDWVTVVCSNKEGMRSREDIHEEIVAIVNGLL